MKKIASSNALLVLFVVLLTSLAGCGSNAFEFLSNDSSNDACRYKASKDLDEGRYNEVLASSCADHLQRGAAYLGLAGYGMTSIIDRMIDANGNNNTANNRITTYLNALISNTTWPNLENIEMSRNEYALVAPGDAGYDDAQFNVITMVNTVRILSLLKGVVDADGNGISYCDINGNGVIDEADAAGCAFMYSAGMSCSSGITVSATYNGLTFPDHLNAYDGIVVDITNSVPQIGCQSSYSHLLDSGGVVATSSETCMTSTGDLWPCPFEVNGTTVGIVNVIDNSLQSAKSYLATSAAFQDSELYTAITELRSDMCGADDICTATDIANYLNNLTY